MGIHECTWELEVDDESTFECSGDTFENSRHVCKESERMGIYTTWFSCHLQIEDIKISEMGKWTCKIDGGSASVEER